MAERRYVVAYGDLLSRAVERAPESYGDNLLTRAEAAQRIVEEMDSAIAWARESRRKAMRVLRRERAKGHAND